MIHLTLQPRRARVEAESRRRGYDRLRVGGRIYCALEAVVVADVVNRELDLGANFAQIQEAKWESGGSQT